MTTISCGGSPTAPSKTVGDRVLSAADGKDVAVFKEPVLLMASH
jgi:hypothetical protein